MGLYNSSEESDYCRRFAEIELYANNVFVRNPLSADGCLTEKPKLAVFAWSQRTRGTARPLGFLLHYLEQLNESYRIRITRKRNNDSYKIKL